MPPSDLDIARLAQLWIQQYGTLALLKARQQVEQLRRNGDLDCADTWLRIVEVIGRPSEPTTGAPQ
jgi:hypothetical protein